MALKLNSITFTDDDGVTLIEAKHNAKEDTIEIVGVLRELTDEQNIRGKRAILRLARSIKNMRVRN